LPDVVATSASSRRRGGSVALSLMFTEIRRDKNGGVAPEH
jgi:hypothetical protein